MGTIIFASSIVEYVLRGNLSLVCDYGKIEKAGLGTLCNLARRYKVVSKDDFQQLLMIKEMRNMLAHADTDSDFASELMDAAYSDITYDPYIQRTWFFNEHNFTLMAKTCAQIAKGFVSREVEDM